MSNANKLPCSFRKRDALQAFLLKLLRNPLFFAQKLLYGRRLTQEEDPPFLGTAIPAPHGKTNLLCWVAKMPLPVICQTFTCLTQVSMVAVAPSEDFKVHIYSRRDLLRCRDLTVDRAQYEWPKAYSTCWAYICVPGEAPVCVRWIHR